MWYEDSGAICSHSDYINMLEKEIAEKDAEIDYLKDALRDMIHELKNASKLLKNSYSPLLADALEIDECLDKHQKLLSKINNPLNDTK